MFLVWPCVGAVYSYCLTRISYMTIQVQGPGLFNSSIFNGGVSLDAANNGNQNGLSDEEQMARLQELMNERAEQQEQRQLNFDEINFGAGVIGSREEVVIIDMNN